MSHTIAAVHVNLHQGVFGHSTDLTQPLADVPVLVHTLKRLDRVKGLKTIVLLVFHQGHDTSDVNTLNDLIDSLHLQTPVTTTPCSNTSFYTHAQQMLTASRKWCLTGWRGGIGSSTIFDEALPPEPILQAMSAQNAESALLVRGDWCLFDPQIATQLIERHTQSPSDFPVVFTQAAPGLSGVVCSQNVLEQFAEHHAGFGQALGYNPRHAHGDPVGKDVCLPVSANVRDAYTRFVFDTPRSQQLIKQIADYFGPSLIDQDAESIAQAAQDIQSQTQTNTNTNNNNNNTQQQNHTAHCLQQTWPYSPTPLRWATLELTPKRPATGPITPQHHCPEILNRPDMSLETAQEVLTQLGQYGDVPVIFGGLGDPLLHPNWQQVVQLAHDAGVLGIAIETDLHTRDPNVLNALANSDIDLISIRLNADKKETYAQLMGCASTQFDDVIESLKDITQIKQAYQSHLPFIVPKLAKTTDNVSDLEGFYERWKTILGHAVIDRSPQGFDAQGNRLMPDLSPVDMQSPTPVKWPTDHLHILSDGTLTADSTDWLGQRPLTPTASTELASV